MDFGSAAIVSRRFARLNSRQSPEVNRLRHCSRQRSRTEVDRDADTDVAADEVQDPIGVSRSKIYETIAAGQIASSRLLATFGCS
jgi:hypothetical protein